jgi:acyl-CoA synthetase (NDP forming)
MDHRLDRAVDHLTHRLDPVLRPRSVAILGASPREGAVGNMFLRQLRIGGFEAQHGGRLYLVNPRYPEIDGETCYPSLAALPELPEHVAFAVPNGAIEETLSEAIAAGVPAGTIVSSLALAEDRSPTLAERVSARCREAGFLLCGANGMGFYNFVDGVWMCGFRTRSNHRPGSVAFLSHSGSALCAVVDAEARIDYNYVVSSGQELSLGLADYLDFVLAQPSTRVIALFIEAARDPGAFEAALARAQRQRVPVVVLKVGRTAASAALFASHSGALAGDDGVYQALFERYGVQRVASLDELAATIMLFQQSPAPLGAGGLATMHDSGGERELIIDLAERHGVPFAGLDPATIAALAGRLDPGLAPVNPLDAWGTGNDAQGVYRDCLTVLMQNPETAIGAIVCDRRADGVFNQRHGALAASVMAATGKPVVVCSNHQGSGDSNDTIAVARGGVPVLDGVPAFLTAVRKLFDFRDFVPPGPAPRVDPATVARWRERLAPPGPLSEEEGLDLLADFGVPAVARRGAATRGEAVAAADALGYPVVLKTAMPGIAHKSDVGGVKLGLETAAAVAAAYDDMASRLGPRMLVAPMVGTGVEMILGLTRDPEFGPTVLIGAGGIHAEILRDVVLARPPFDAAWARRLIDRLRLRRLLDGVRGQAASDVAALADAAARFSGLAAALGDRVKEIDVNPIIVLPTGCVAVDALVIAGS